LDERRLANQVPLGPVANATGRGDPRLASPPSMPPPRIPDPPPPRYAVRGEIVIRAGAIEKELEEGPDAPCNAGRSYTSLIKCNIGNPQQLQQPPLTWFRQVLALVDCPGLLDLPGVRDAMPADVVERAAAYRAGFGGSSGSYTDSRGALAIRQSVCDGIQARDGYPADPQDIFMTDGATPAVHMACRLLIRERNDGFLVPIPQYPLYSACLELYNGTLVPYYLDEDAAWGLDVAHLSKQLAEARASGVTVRGLVVINPGNPTGQCLDAANQKEVLRFCAREGLVLMADEVYQSNVYAQGKSFTSFKKTLRDIEQEDGARDGGAESGQDWSQFPLMSMMSTSKGFYGECGRRGGYVECLGVTKALADEVYKLQSISLCANTGGQVVMGCVMSPPAADGPSRKTFEAERDAILSSLARRAATLSGAFNRMEGVSCNDPEGAMYLFPRITLPAGAVKAAAAMSPPKSPEFLYCLRLLEEEGIVTVPGDGFGQRDGTHHVRMTFLPPEDRMTDVADRLSRFHARFLAEHGGL